MTVDYDEPRVEALLREAMSERAAAFEPGQAPGHIPGRAPEHAGSAWRPALLAAAAVVVVLSTTWAVGSQGIGVPATPASPAPTSSAPPSSTLADSSSDALTWPGPPQPGSDLIIPLADSVTVTATGTQTIDLGPRPEGANGIDLRFTCLTTGSFRYSDGAGPDCAPHDVGKVSQYTHRIPDVPRVYRTTITTSPEAEWRLIATYVSIETTPWAVNERGQTYGVENDNGSPDLISAYATNGLVGYVLAAELDGPQPANPSEALTFTSPPMTIPVYESDGITVIGSFSRG